MENNFVKYPAYLPLGSGIIAFDNENYVCTDDILEQVPATEYGVVSLSLDFRNSGKLILLIINNFTGCIN